MLIRLLRILTTTLLALIVITVLLAGWFLFTPEGNREGLILLRAAEPRFSLQLTEGSLLRGIRADTIRWHDKNLQIDAKTADSDWDLKCLLALKFCAEKISVQELHIRWQSQSETKNSKPRELKLPPVKLPVSLDIERLSVGKLYLHENHGNKPYVIENIQLQASSEQDAVRIERLSARYQTYIASTSGQVTLDGNYPLDLKLAAIAEGLLDGHDLSITADLNGSLSALRFDVESFGALAATLKGSVNTLAPRVPLFATLQWQENGWPLDTQSILTVKNGILDIQGDLDGWDTRLKTHLSGANIPASNISISGQLKTSEFRATDINVGLLSGHLRGNASINWQEGLDWGTQLHFNGIDPARYLNEFPGSLAGNIQASGSADSEQGWTLDLNPLVIQGELHGTPLHAHATGSHHSDGHWQLDSLYLTSRNNTASVQGSINDTLDLSGDLDLQQLDLLLPDATGAIEGNFNLSGQTASPDIHLNLQSADFGWQQIAVSDMSLTAKVTDLANGASGASVSIGKMVSGETVVEKIRLNAEGNRKSHTVDVSATGPSSTAVEATVTGSLSEKLDWIGSLLSAELDIPEHRWVLKDSVDVKWQNNQKSLVLASHCWLSAGAHLCLTEDSTFDIQNNSGSASLALSDYSLATLNAFLPESSRITGSAKVDADLAWSPSLPGMFSLDARLDASDGSLRKNGDSETLTFDFDRLSVTAKSAESGIQTTITLNSTSLGEGRARFTLDTAEKPLSFSSGKLDLNGLDLDFLQAFLPEMDKVAGKLFADLEFAGPLTAPDVAGNITLRKPELLSQRLPLQVTGGRISLDIRNTSAAISGRIDSGNGLIDLAGRFDWRNADAWSLDLRARGDALVFRQKPLVHSVVAPDLTISVKPGDVVINGKVAVIAAAVTVREIPEGAVSPSDEIRVITEESEAKPEPASWNVQSDVQVELGDAVRLSAYGLKAQLKGDVRLVSNRDQPLELFGEIAIPEGTYKSYGQDLTIKDGQILLIGPIDQSALDIEAYREVDEVRAGLHITGSMETPVLTLQSEPPLEQERILAYIVLGRDIAAGENNDSNILATAAIAMGIKNGRGLATDIAETFGVREFNIEASGRGEDTQVLLSGRLSSRLQVRYGVGVFTPVNTLYLRYDLGRKIYLETAQGLERAVDLFYSLEF